MDFFSDEAATDSPQELSKAEPWVVLLVDDEPEVHAVTQMSLRNFEFLGRPVELLSAHSKNQGFDVYRQHPEIALALIDVVMETDQAGLELVELLRREFPNRNTRLVLRTGQPGQAPEDRVIRDYEIDGYYEKTEMTVQKLRSLLYTSLRSYRDLCIIKSQRDGIERVLQATNKVQSVSSFKEFASAVLSQLASLLALGDSALYCLVREERQGEMEFHTLAATGSLNVSLEENGLNSLPDIVKERFEKALQERQSCHYQDAYLSYLRTEAGNDNLLYVTHAEALNELDKQLLEVFTQNITVTFENLNLLENVRETQKELVYILADAVEARSKETGAHVQRVALASEKLALLAGLSPQEAELIKLAAPLHDIGKVAIPDAILHKPGKLDADEWQLMQQHVQHGVEILKRSSRPLMRMGAEVALYHHERWDGTGYPQGLAGEQIPLVGRILAIADVFDALGSKRCYKPAWSQADIRDLLLQERGKHFDPQLTDLLLAHIDDFFALRQQFPDEDSL